MMAVVDGWLPVLIVMGAEASDTNGQDMSASWGRKEDKRAGVIAIGVMGWY